MHSYFILSLLASCDPLQTITVYKTDILNMYILQKIIHVIEGVTMHWNFWRTWLVTMFLC